MKHSKSPAGAYSAFLATLLAGVPLTHAQQVPTLATANETEDDAIVLPAFTVDASQDRGYQAAQTLAGTRIRTDLADVGSSISVLTKEFMNDVGGYNNQTVLGYALSTEVGGPRGNFSASNRGGEDGRILEGSFANQNQNTRVRGLTAADNTRNFFLSDVQWDGYNVARVDLQRGPNAILFGLGSPAGIVNTSTHAPSWKTSGSVEAMFDKYGTVRGALDYNRELIHRELAVRIDLVDSQQKFQQKPAHADDTRAYAAVRWAPAALNQNGNSFEVSLNAEHGEIAANYPRSIPPQDYYSGYWRSTATGGTNKGTVDVFRDFWSNGNSANYATYGGGTYNLFGPGPTIYGNAGASNGLVDNRNIAFGSYSKTGQLQLTPATIDNSAPWLYKGNGPNSGLYRLSTLPEYITGDRSGDVPFKSLGSAAYKPRFVSDSSVFDFYHKLIDGDNKREGQRWNAYSVDLQQSFLNNLFSYQLTAYRENFKRSSMNLLQWWGNGIYLDVNDSLPDGSSNPNLGRLYVANLGVASADTEATDRHAYRAQANVQYDFAKRHRNELWATVLGSQSVTGVFADEGFRRDSRSYTPYDISLPWRRSRSFTQEINTPNSDGGLGGAFVYYISGDTRNTNGTGINASALRSRVVDWNAKSVQMKYFDNTWTAGSAVSPTAVWNNPNDPANSYLQNQNPSNYKGWTNASVDFGTYNDATVAPGTGGLSWRDYLTNYAALNDYRVRSAVGVWQGAFWKHSIVGVFGWRSDSARNYLFASGFGRPGGTVAGVGSANLGQNVYNYEQADDKYSNSVTTHTKNWSVMAHLNRLLPSDVLPVNIRLYYNRGENFRPEARIDFAGRKLAPPGGSTKEKAIAISTKDDRFSLRLTHFETQVVGATNGAASNSNIWALQQIVGGAGGSDPTLHRKDAYPGAYARSILNGTYSDTYFSTPGYPGWSAEQASHLKEYAQDWMNFEKEFKDKFPEFVNTWFGGSGTAAAFGSKDINGLIPVASQPLGAVWTEDTDSKGYELEFTANPTKDWRITLNAAKTEAVRTNVGGAYMRAVSDFVDNAVLTRPLGNLPIWWDGNTGGIVGRIASPFNSFHPGWVAQKVGDGQSAGEVPKYTFNVITSYDFTGDLLKGFGVGGAYQWQDRTVLGYAPIRQKNPAGIYEDTLNIHAPFRGPTDSTVGLWFSYRRKLSAKIDWKIQLNLFNVGGKNKLVPISAGADIDQIRAMQSAGVTFDENTKVPMIVNNWRIKEGMSWQVTNTFEF